MSDRGHHGPYPGAPQQQGFPPQPAPPGQQYPAHPPQAAPPSQQPTGPTRTDWSYGLPPGVRPDLLSAPLGQHGAMAGSAWERRGSSTTPFPRLVLVELRKLAGTLSDRVMLALAPLALIAATWFGVAQVATEAPTSASAQNLGLLLACHVGQLPVYTVVLKTFSGEWHYRSIQLTLLLQPSRTRYGLAQLVAVFVLWLTMALLQFAAYFPLKNARLDAGVFQNFIGGRPLWMLGIALLASFLGLLFAMSVTLLVRNPTAAVTIYLLAAGLYLFRFTNPPVLGYFDPWQPASLLAGQATAVWPSLSSGALLLAALVTGFLLLRRRDAG